MAALRLWHLALMCLPLCTARLATDNFMDHSHAAGLSDEVLSDIGYAGLGPFKFRTVNNLQLQGSTQDPGNSMPQPFTIPLTITIPLGVPTGPAQNRSAPFPVVVFMNGFQQWADYYKPYAQRLASWGFVFVQYDTPSWLPAAQKIVEDRTEVQYFPDIVAWLRTQNITAGGFLNGLLDLDNIATAGHSRGGKLAGLIYAEQAELVKTAFLVDPVDNSTRTPESDAYPSAVKALAKAQRPFGLLGAGCLGRCNPNGPNYKAFFAAAAEGSVQGVVKQAGHALFASAGWARDLANKALCNGGGTSPTKAIETSLPPMLAWVDKALRPSPHQEKLLDNFLDWAKLEEKAGRLTVTAKPGAKAADGSTTARNTGAQLVNGERKQEPAGSLRAAVA